MILHIDHLVLTVASLNATCSFYERALKFNRVDAPGRPTSLHFGTCKISVHEVDHTFEPKASSPTPGSSDFCLITDVPLAELAAHLRRENIPLELGPVDRMGAQGDMKSLYFRDPDNNLVEVSEYSA